MYCTGFLRKIPHLGNLREKPRVTRHCTTLTLRVPSHVSGMRCVFAQTHESERDSSISASLSLSWFCAKTQRIPDTWDGTLRVASHICVLTQRWTQSHESERDSSICVSLSGWRPMVAECVAFCGVRQITRRH